MFNSLSCSWELLNVIHRGCQAVYVAVTSIGSLKLNVHSLVFASHRDNSFLESDVSWTIFVEDCDNTFGVISLQKLFCGFIKQLDFEVLVWLPIIVVDNGDLNFTGTLMCLQRDQFVLRIVVMGSFSSAVYSFYPEREILFYLLLDGDGNELSRLRHRIPKMLEAYDLV